MAGALADLRNGESVTGGEDAKAVTLDAAIELFDGFSDKDKILKGIKDMPLSARMMSNQIEATQVKGINA